MNLLGLIILLVIAGLVMWLVNTYVPMQPQIKQLLNVVVIVILAVYVLVFLLNLAGVNLGSPRFH